jgi:hypothetical protein
MEYGPRLLLAPDGRRYWSRIRPSEGAGQWLTFERHQGGPVLYAPIPRHWSLLTLDADDLEDTGGRPGGWGRGGNRGGFKAPVMAPRHFPPVGN